MAESEGSHRLNHDAILVETSGQAHGVGEIQPCDRRVQSRFPSVVHAAKDPSTDTRPSHALRHAQGGLMDFLWILTKQQGANQLAIEVHLALSANNASPPMGLWGLTL